VDAGKRREQIIQLLTATSHPVTGSELAEKFSVSRQVIVQDIALLRAQGKEIIATPRGYMFFSANQYQPLRRTFACRHDRQETQRELNIFVDCGGTVEDVIVEHPFYGQISGSLMLKSRTDVEHFCRKIEQSGASLLSSLTEGVHLHTIRADNEETFTEIEKQLGKACLLLKNED